MAKTKQLRWYFSLRSPYSWFAYRELLAQHPDVLDAAEWLPVWEPDEWTTRLLADEGVHSLPYTDMSKAKALYILQDTRRLAAARGLSMTWPVDTAPVWEVAHLGYLAALDGNRGREFVAATYRARWEHGRDISDPAVIAEVAAQVGLDAERVAGAHRDPVYRARGVEQLKLVDRQGVFGVPMFLHGRNKFWGVDRLPDFIASVRGSGLPEPEPVDGPVVLGVGADAGHAGGCG
ncbi:2-hydroxychromene-2-carboxylate isomerase [Goodfellowiella coeruleoviolacea]|uniref:2-hydroxychromene-2-carboxylate isomerase n=1 Tax=Goodfellowiella coeruleoviolacea TaxID=334858 RepID=A0AAE3KDV6_9PSEU|nr:DsbA family protein [Goodfellowiella coeruleoviolacea]MCP2163192.1 2-hydroxychromene-2-carboxylate isomerase [Goodfellowiella coeruleoviolacea]